MSSSPGAGDLAPVPVTLGECGVRDGICSADIELLWANLIAYSRLAEFKLCLEIRVSFGACCDTNHREGDCS